MTKPKRTEITGQGTFVEFETAYAVLHMNYIYDSGERRKEVPSTRLKDLPFMGDGVKAITFECYKNRQMTLGEHTLKERQPIKEQRLSGIYYVDAELWDRDRVFAHSGLTIRKNDNPLRPPLRQIKDPDFESNFDKLQDKLDSLNSNLRALENSECELLVKMKSNYLLPFDRKDAVITWKTDPVSGKACYVKIPIDEAKVSASRQPS